MHLLEVVVAAGFLIAALVPLFRWNAKAGLISVLGAIVIGAALFSQRPSESSRPYLPKTKAVQDYVSSDSCKSCHPGNYESWHDSYHRTMTQPANPQSIVADFDNVTLTARNRTYELERDGDEFFVTMPDPDWEAERAAEGLDFEMIPNPPLLRKRVVMTTGSHHMQAFWVNAKKGNELHQVPWEFYIPAKKWVPSAHAQVRPPEKGRPFGHWNSSCIKCHSVAGNPGMKPETKELFSKVAEIGIACEACHGPGEKHIAFHKNPLNRYQQHFSKTPDPTIVNPSKLSAERSSQICGRCHSNFNPIDYEGYWFNGDQYKPGEDLELYQETVRFGSETHDQMIEDGRAMYWDDGTCRVGGREYLGLLESKCYQEGEMSCITCHSMHHYEKTDDQLKTVATGDQVCMNCHQDIAKDISAHSHHAVGSTGSSCLNCHMPHVSYALYKGIRSHRIRSPNAAITSKTGRPNACNLCHLDQTMEWTADHLTKWYGQPAVELSQDEKQIAASVLAILKGDAAQRVLMSWHFSWPPALEVSGDDWQPPFLAHTLSDPYGALRFVAYQSLIKNPEFSDFKYDPVAPETDRLRDAVSALKKWENANEKQARPKLLIQANGRLDSETIGRLKSQRDNHPVEIPE